MPLRINQSQVAKKGLALGMADPATLESVSGKVAPIDSKWNQALVPNLLNVPSHGSKARIMVWEAASLLVV